MSAFTRHIPRGSARVTGWPRLFILFALARGTLGGLALIFGLASLYGVLQDWAATDSEEGWGTFEALKQFGMMQGVPALIASVIGIGAWSPFGEPERTAASSLTRLRLVHGLLLLGPALAVSAAYLLTWTSRAAEVDLGLVALRNGLGFTGAALLVGRFVDARLSWTLPVGLAVIAVLTAVNGAPDAIWSPPSWLWNSQAHDTTASWLVALALLAVGGALYLRDGVRDTTGDEE